MVLLTGVSQSGILLISIFIDLVTNHIQYTYHLYAEDLRVHKQSRVEDISRTIDKVNKYLQFIQNWLTRFGLAVNPTKCRVIVVGSNQMLHRFDISVIPVTTI